MKTFKILGVTCLGLSLVAGLFVYKTLASERVDQPYAYRLINQSDDIKLDPGTPGQLTVTIRNIGQESWPVEGLRLGTVYFDGTPGRISYFATSEWEGQHLIKPTTDRIVVAPMDKVSFDIPIQAVSDVATYRETFQPIVNGIWVSGAPVEWLIQVGGGVQIQDSETGEKQIKISLDKQRLWAIEDHVVVMDIPISSGKPGYSTQKGSFQVFNHIDTAYSAEYKLYMDNWMALANLKGQVQRMGLHKLPYWRVNPAKYQQYEGQYIGSRFYTNGKLYEDAKHLGKRMSHGCIRLGLVEAPILYQWAEKGTPVEIA